MKYLFMIMVMFLGLTAHAGFHGFEGSTDLGLFNQLKCGQGLTCSKLEGKMTMVQDIKAASTFVDSDATPDVSNAMNFETNTTTVTITDFDGSDIFEGQIIYIVSKGAITFDVTSSGIKGGTTDIVTAAGDLSMFMYDGADWILISRMDMSDSYN